MKEKNENFKMLMTFAIAAIMCLTTLAIVPTTTAASTMFLLEDFSGGAIPVTWIPEEAGEWSYQPNGVANITVYPSFSPCMELYWSDVPTDYSYIDTAPVDTSSASDLTLRFSTYLSDYVGGYDCRVYVRADSMDTWTDVTPWSNPISGSIPCYRYTIDITSDIGSGTQVRFEFDGDNYDFNWWDIDDVQIYGETGGDPWPDCKMHYPQLPDPFGWDVFATMSDNILADDFLCTETGPITDLHFWGSWFADMMPNPEGRPEGFHISFHADIPDPDGEGPLYSMPGELLWERDIFIFGSEPEIPSLQGWFEPPSYYEEMNHEQYFRYDILFEEPYFEQTEGIIYWVDIAPIQIPEFFWGWKTSLDHFNDDAVYSMPASPPETLLEEDFEGYDPGTPPSPSPFPLDPMCNPMSWQIFDNDGDGYLWDSYTTEHHTGDYSVSVRYNSAGQDDWLLTPYDPVAPAPCPMIHDTGTFDLWAMSCSSTYLDDFEVLVWDWIANGPVVCTPPYTGWVSLGTVTSVPNAWTPYSFTLPGTMHEITVAIRCISVDELRFAVDDVSMPATGWGTSFEGTSGTPPSGWPPSGWTNESVSGAYNWKINDTATHPTGTLPYSGTYMAEFDCYSISSGNSARLYTPALAFSGTGHELTFYMNHDDGYTTKFDNVTVQVSTDASVWTDIIELTRYDVANPGWLQHTIDLSAYDGVPVVYVGFLGISDYGNSIYIDDVEITNAGGGAGGWDELRDPITMESLDLAFVITGEEGPEYPVVNIDTGEGFDNIQPAIDDSDTLDDHTITVSAGTYNEALNVNKEVTIQGAGMSQVIIDASGLSGYNNAGIYVSVDNVTLEGFTLKGNSANPPRYGLKVGTVSGINLSDITVQDIYRTGFDLLGTNDSTISNIYSMDNGGHGMQLCDCNGIDISDITMNGNAWQSVSVCTWGRYTTLGTSDIVFSGTNTFVGVFQIEEGDYNNPGVPPSGNSIITYSLDIGDGADVTLQSADFCYAMHGDQDDGPDINRIWFFKTFTDSQTAATYGPIGHFLGTGVFVEGLCDPTQLYVFSPGGSIQNAIDFADPYDTINVYAGYYDGGITIDKSLTIIGAGKTQTIINTSSSPVITVSADDVTIQDLTITDSPELGEGIRVVSPASSGLTVERVAFADLGAGTGANAYGIYIATSFSDLSVLDSDFVSAPHTTNYRTIGIFTPNNLNHNDFEIRDSTFTTIWTSIYLRSAIDGFIVSGNTFESVQLSDCAACVAGIYIGDGDNNNFDLEHIEVYDNTFTEYGRGVYIWNYGANSSIDDLNIHDNLFENSIWSAAIRVIAGIGQDEQIAYSDIVVDNNDFTQNTDIGAHVGMIDLRTYCALSSCDITITNNDIEFTGGPYADPMSGIIFNAYEGPFTNTIIENNMLDGGNTGGTGTPPSSGILLNHKSITYWPSDILDMDITNNEITGFDHGITIYDSEGSQYGGLPAGSILNVNYNNIYGNALYGLRNNNSEIIDATCNWWGDISGPSHSSNPSGIGDIISNNVTFLPWLDDEYPYGDCIGGYVEQLDIEQTIQDRGFPVRHALDGDWGAAQNFTPTMNYISKVEIYMRTFGTPEFDLVVELRTDDPEGTLLDTLTFTPGEVPGAWTWLEVDFEDTYVGIGTDVFIVVPPAPSGVTTSFGYEWGYAFGDQYDEGSFWFTRDGGGLWRDLPTMYEFVFRTYGY